jgi:hypothetical protein
VPSDFGEFVVIQTGTFYPRIIPSETQRFDQMQTRTGIGT